MHKFQLILLNQMLNQLMPKNDVMPPFGAIAFGAIGLSEHGIYCFIVRVQGTMPWRYQLVTGTDTFGNVYFLF